MEPKSGFTLSQLWTDSEPKDSQSKEVRWVVFLFWVCFVFVFVVLCVVVVFAFFLWIVTAAGLSTGSFPVHLCGSHP
jgi:heme/copper-type cytochrome/quinol oxidase subunit 2